MLLLHFAASLTWTLMFKALFKLYGGHIHGMGKNKIFKIHFWEYKAPPFSFSLHFVSNGFAEWEKKKTVVRGVTKLRKGLQ